MFCSIGSFLFTIGEGTHSFELGPLDEVDKFLEVLVGLGFDRVLTSGQAATAEEGIPMLRELVAQAAGRIRIMAGCGVSPSNARRILDETGATDIHASARTLVESRMRWRREDVAMGRSDADEYAFRETSADIVYQIRREID